MDQDHDVDDGEQRKRDPAERLNGREETALIIHRAELGRRVFSSKRGRADEPHEPKNKMPDHLMLEADIDALVFTALDQDVSS